MKSKYIKIFFVLSIILFTLFQPISSAGEVYTSETYGHYENPINGKIEDPGNNPGIGEGMVSNVVNGLSLIEKDDNGKLYATVRYRLRSKIKNIKMWIYNSKTRSFSQVRVSEVKSGGDTGDFRFEIPSTETLIRSSFYVEPMGRDVIFFVSFGKIQGGSGDFKVFVKTSQPVFKTDVSNNRSVLNDSNLGKAQNRGRTVYQFNNENKNKNNTAISKDDNKSTTKSNSNGLGNNLNHKSEKDECKTSKSTRGYTHGLLTNKDYKDTKEASKKEEVIKEDGEITRYVKLFVVIVLAIIFSAFILGAILICIFYKFIKNNNLKKEEALFNGNSSNRNNDSCVVDRCLPINDENSVSNSISNKYRKSDTKIVGNDKKDNIWKKHPGFMEDDGNE